MDIGQGLASFGNNIADAMDEYHKRHQAYDQQMSIAQALSQVGITPDGQITSVAAGEQSGQKVKPVIDPKALEMFQARNQHERDLNLGALHALGQVGSTFLQHQIADQVQHQRDIPTDIAGATVPLSPAQFATQTNENRRIDIASQPRGESANLTYRKAQDLAKQQAKDQEKLPEFQFQKKYQILPKDILNQPMGYNTQFSVDPTKDDKSQREVTGYVPTTQVYREREFQTNQQGVKQKGYAPDPNGELVNFKGQRIPFQEYQTLQNRAKFLYDRAAAALARGGDPAAIGKRLEEMGFDPAGVQ